MIHIVKHGKVPLYQGFCMKCGCTVEFTAYDALKEDGGDYVICPDCGEKITRTARIC